MQGKEEKALEKYKALKKIQAGITHADENGNLVPENPKYYNEVVKEIQGIEKEYPKFNILKDL